MMMIVGKQQAGNQPASQPTRRTWYYLHTQIERVIIDGWDGMPWISRNNGTVL